MYYGWIPNVSGYLSFNHIGGIRIRHRVRSESIHPPTKFHSGDTISLLQDRNLSDRPEIGWLKFGTGPGEHTFLLQAMTCMRGAVRTLEGVVISTPFQNRAALVNAHAAFKAGALSIASPLPQQYRQFIASLQTNLGAGHFCLSFKLDDDGILEMDSLANAGPNDLIGSLLAFEAYSFLKDILHKHRFHSPTDDALLELTQAPGINHPDFCRNVVRNLHRSIIASFRSNSSAQTQALGKLAYLEAFISVVKRRGLALAPDISTATLREALTQYQDIAAQEREDKNLRTTYFVSLAAIAIPLFLVCLQLLQIPCIDGLTFDKASCTVEAFKVSPSIVGLTRFMLANLFVVILGGILVFGFAVYLLTSQRFERYTQTQLGAASWWGDLRDHFMRLHVSHGFTTMFCFYAAGALFLFLVYWIVQWLLRHPLPFW